MIEGYYDSPLTMYEQQIHSDIKENTDKMILEEIHKVGVYVDKDKLIQALNQDRERYQEAYRKGYRARENEIVECHECRYRDSVLCPSHKTEDDFYCKAGKRKDPEEDD